LFIRTKRNEGPTIRPRLTLPFSLHGFSFLHLHLHTFSTTTPPWLYPSARSCQNCMPSPPFPSICIDFQTKGKQRRSAFHEILSTLSILSILGSQSTRTGTGEGRHVPTPFRSWSSLSVLAGLLTIFKNIFIPSHPSLFSNASSLFLTLHLWIRI